MDFNKKRPRVLFFQADAVATEDEMTAMEKLAGATVLPRNAAVVDGTERAEDADAVAGTVPKLYEHLPTVSSYGEAKRLLEARDRKQAKEADAAPAGAPAGGPAPASKTPPGWGSGGNK